jgi:hypothetical protein
MPTFADKFVTPCNCKFAVGIPASHEAFREAVARPYDDNFAKRFLVGGGWLRYKSEVIDDLQELFAVAEDLGVSVTDRTTRDLLPGLFCDPQRPIVILVAHWDDNKRLLELSDGFVSVDEFVDAVNPSFHGVLDLGACRPKELVGSLRVSRPNCLIRYGHYDESTPYIWIAFYSVLLRYLAQGNHTYLQALEDVVDEFTKRRISMRSLRAELHGFLARLGVLTPVTLGAEKTRTFSDDDKLCLRRILETQQKFNNRVLSLAIGMVAALFLLGVFFAIYYRNNPSFLQIVLGSNLFSILVTVTWVRKLWIEKGLVDLATLAVEEMSTEEAIRLASTIYWSLLAGKERGTHSKRERHKRL